MGLGYSKSIDFISAKKNYHLIAIIIRDFWQIKLLEPSKKIRL